MFVPDYFVILVMGFLLLIVVLVLLKALFIEAPRALWRRLRKRP